MCGRTSVLAKLDPSIGMVYERHCPQKRAAARPPVLWGKGGGLISPAPRQDAQPLSDQVHRVAGFAIALVAVLADPSGDVNQVALAQISGALCQLAEERHTVPVRIGLPFIAILAVVVRGDGNVGDFIGRIDTANAADDPKFSDVLHGSLLWISVADGFFAAELSHAGKLTMGGSACGKSEEHTSELQSLMRISYAVFCLKKKINQEKTTH